MIRILNIIFDERTGGPQKRVVQVAKRLVCQGFETEVVIPKGESDFPKLLEEASIRYHEINLVRMRDSTNPSVHLTYITNFAKNFFEIRRLIRTAKINIVHTNGLMNIQGALAAKAEKVGLVWHLNDVLTPRIIVFFLMPFVHYFADQIIVASNAVIRYCFNNNNTSRKNINIIYPPVNPDLYHERNSYYLKKELNLKKSYPIIGTIGNLTPIKGIHFLIEAAPIIKLQFPDAKFIIIGDFLKNRKDYWSKLIQRTNQLKLSEDILFTGYRNDIPNLMGIMDVYVHPSKSEAAPMSVLEAMAAGLPIVASDVGGVKEILGEGIAGILVPPNSPEKLAEAVIDLINSPEIAKKMGIAGPLLARNLFSIDECVKRHAKVYKNAYTDCCG